MKKIILGLTGGLFILVFLGLATGAWLLGTQSGLDQVMSLAKKSAPGKLSWQLAKGQLSRQLELRDLRYQQEDGLQLKIESAQLQWQARQLIGKRLRVDQLQVNGVEIHLPESKPAEKPSSPMELPDLRLPVSIDLHELDLRDIRIFPYGAAEPIIVDAVQLVAAGEGETLQLINLALNAPQGTLALKGNLNPVGDYPLNLSTDWQYNDEQLGKIIGKGALDGELKNHVKLTHEIEGPVKLQVEAVLETLFETPHWEANLLAASADLGLFLPQLKGAPLEATLTSVGSPDAFNISGHANTRADLSGNAALNLDIKGSTKELTVEQILLELIDAKAALTLNGQIDLEKTHIDLHGNWQGLGWPLLGVRDYELEQGVLTLSGSPEIFKMTVESQLSGRLLGDQQLMLQASRQSDVLLLEKFALISADKSQSLNVEGQFDAKNQHFSGKGGWSNLSWPMTGAAQYASPKGQFEARGGINDYQFQVNADTGGIDFPKGQWQLSGTGSEQMLENLSIKGKTLEGEISGAGQLRWAPAVDWTAAIDVRAINPGVQWPGADGKINAKLKSTGSIEAGRPLLEARIDELGGTWRNKKLNGQGVITLNGEDIDIQQLALGFGKARLTANGYRKDQWQLEWLAEIPDLAELLPDAQGRFSGKGQLQGPKDVPAGSFELEISKLRFDGIGIQSLKGQGMLDLSGGQSSNLALTGQGITAAGTQWSSLALNGGGVPANHQLKLDLKGDLAQLAVQAEGRFKDDAWAGKLTALDLLKTELGDWRLKQPAPVSSAAGRADLFDLCLASTPSVLCVDGGWSAAQGSTGEIQVSELRPERFKAWLPEGLTLNTALNGAARVQVPAGAAAQGTLDFTLSRGELNWEGNGEPVRVALGESTLSAALRNDAVTSKSHLDLGTLGELDSELGVSQISGAQKLIGGVKGKIVELALISAFVPQIQEVAGQLSTDLQFAGTTAKPVVRGDLALSQFSAEIPQVGIRIEDTELKLANDDSGALRIAGQSQSGSGQLELKGLIRPENRQLSLNLSGKDYQVANTRTMKAEISPDMEIKMGDEGMSVEGELLIPRAYINAKGASRDDVTTASPDLVIIEEDGVAEPSSPASQVNVNLRVTLGDDIVVEAADFSGGLKGSLLVEQSPELAPRGTGTIEVKKGDYVVYGQKLAIQRGKILFGGGPIDNPRLDLEVARKVEAYDVLAGARIGGTAQAPLLQLYSEPAMPDASILSYMLLGQPPGTKGASFTLGKYITPDLYVSYGIGLFDAINTFNLRYSLTRKLAVLGASGLASSADLVYSFER
ncbi:MAG: translocation/assembly module TamB domain-containing protein [Thiotrichales bacterium]